MGRTLVVTGANSGIGLATALELAAAGYDVIGTVRSPDKAKTLQDAAVERALSVRTVQCDVADAEQTRQAFEEVAAMTDGGPWALVNNAGFGSVGAVEDVDDELVHQQLEVNLVAPIRIARLVLPSMRARGDGRIVNVSSMLGRVSVPFSGWYAASKHGLEAVTDALRVEVARYGVKVVLVEPGGFGTGIWGGAQFPTESATEEYATSYRRAQQLTDAAVRFMPDPVWVARAIRVALGAPAPLARYLVGVDAMSGVVADKITPTAIGDFVKGAVTGLRKLGPFG